MPQLFWIIPLEGGHISNELPGGPPGHVGGGPIYHPGDPDHGRPVDPGYGRPGWRPTDPGYGQGGRPHPGNRPPGSGAYPGNALPEGEDVEISNELPPIPPEYADKVIVAIKRPNVTEWTVKAYDVDSGIDNTLPPVPEPK